MDLADGVGPFVGLTLLSSVDALSSSWGCPVLFPPCSATAALLFVAPKAPFSQPRNVIIGTALSAFIAVAIKRNCASSMAPGFVRAVAVAATILASKLLNVVHPPAAAVAALCTGPASGLGYRAVPASILGPVFLIAVQRALMLAKGNYERRALADGVVTAKPSEPKSHLHSA